MSTSARVTPRRRHHALAVRIEQLPLAERTAIQAIDRYLASTGPADDGWLLDARDAVVSRFEAAHEAGFSIADVVGADPAAFADSFARTYADGARRVEARADLLAAIADAEFEQGPL